MKLDFLYLNANEDSFEKVYGIEMSSYLLNEAAAKHCSATLCKHSYDQLLKNKKFYTVSDVDKYYKESRGKAPQYKSLKEQQIKSAILAPITDEVGLLGILEIVSKKPQELNSINANKLNDVMPFIVEAVQRSRKEEENLIEAIIQKECTSISSQCALAFCKRSEVIY